MLGQPVTVIDDEGREDVTESIELFPMQKSVIRESAAGLHKSEKAQFKSVNPKFTFKVSHIYPYANKIYQTEPAYASKKFPSIYCVANGYAPGSYFLGYSNGEIHLINMLDRISVHYTFDSILALKVHPKEERQTTLISLSCVGQVQYIHSSTGKKLQEFNVGDEFDKKARTMQLSPLGDKMAVSYKNGSIEIFDENIHTSETFLDNGSVYGNGHVNAVHSLAFSNINPSVLVSGGRDKRVCLWDLRKKDAFKMITSATVLGESVDTKDRNVIVGDYVSPGNIYVYDTRKFQDPVETITTNTSAYYCKFCPKPNSNMFAFCGFKGTNVQIFNDFKIVGKADYADSVYAADFTKNSRMLSYGCQDGAVRILDIKPSLTA